MQLPKKKEHRYKKRDIKSINKKRIRTYKKHRIKLIRTYKTHQ